MDVLDHQVELEKEMHAAGRARVERRAAVHRAEGRHRHLPGADDLVGEFARAVLCGLLALEADDELVRKVELWPTVTARLTKAQLAVRTALTIVDALGDQQTEVSLAALLGSSVQNECMAAELRKDDLTGYNRTLRRSRPKGPKRMLEQIRREARKRALPAAQWRVGDRTMLGLALFELADLAMPDLMHRYMAWRRGKMAAVVQLSETAQQWLTANVEWYASRAVDWRPFVQVPKPWTGLWDGMRHSEHVVQLPFVIPRGPIDARTYTPKALGLAMTAANKAGATAWRVNDRVLDTARELWRSQVSTPALPSWQDEQMPEAPEGCPPHERKWVRRMQAMIYERRRRQQADRFRYAQTISCALEARGQRLFYPHRADLRGRLYPVGAYLHPQSFDLARGMLEFDEKVEVERGTEGERHLLLAGANLYGWDKLPLDERLERIRAVARDVQRVARDPLEELWWTEADDPWAFLGWCLDVAPLFRSGRTHSAHPCRLDASTNAAQVAALLMRDPELAQWTNLTPAAEPFDIYTRVGQKVDGRLQQNDPLAEVWRAYLPNGVPRKLVKGPTMTDLYGVTAHGVNGQVDEWYQKQKAKTNEPLAIDDPFPALLWMARQVRTSVADGLGRATELKAFVRAVGRALVRQGVDPMWRSPSGFPVRLKYRKPDVDVVFLPSGTARRSIVVEHDTDVVAERKAVNAVMPNLIHALDGALLHHVLSAVPRAWSVTIIHDCYGTHATRTGQLHKLLRRHTFELFSQPVLENWLDVMRSSADDPTLLPELPELGSFDPADVLHAPYAFS